MAGVGEAASIISIFSIAVQIGDSIHKAIQFWDSIEDAPDDVSRLSMELRTLSNVLVFLRHEESSGKVPDWQHQLVKDSLMLVKKDVDKLCDVVVALDARFRGPKAGKRRQIWGRIQTSLKASEISKLRGYIESAMAVLNLLQTSRTQYVVCQLNGNLNLLAASIQETRDSATAIIKASPITQPLIQDEAPPPIPTVSQEISRTSIQTSWRSYTNSLGMLSFRSSCSEVNLASLATKDEQEKLLKQQKTKTIIISLILRFGSCRRGFRLRTNALFDLWAIDSVRKVPDDSSIFISCQKGSVTAVKRLIQLGQASPFDVDSLGRSPLHKACQFARSDLCELLLLDYGADAYLTDNANQTPIQMLHGYSQSLPRLTGHPLDMAIVADTLDVIMRHGQFDALSSVDETYSTIEHQGFTLGEGLPLMNLQYVLQGNVFGNDYESRCRFIYSNVRELRAITPENELAIEFLCKKYEFMRHMHPDYSIWQRVDPLLFICIDEFIWAYRHGTDEDIMAEKAKIKTVLKLTKDLHRTNDIDQTAIDYLATTYPGSMHLWLLFLRTININLRDYGKTEKSLHRSGYLRNWKPCCSHLKIEFKFGQSQEDLSINIAAKKDKQFQHLNMEYLCQGAAARRQRCLASIDSALISPFGNPLPRMPGTWDAELKPNSELIWVRHWGGMVLGVESLSNLSNPEDYTFASGF